MRCLIIALLLGLLSLRWASAAPTDNAIVPFRSTTLQPLTLQIRTGVSTTITASFSEGNGAGAGWFYIINSVVAGAGLNTAGVYPYVVLNGSTVTREGVLNWNGSEAISSNVNVASVGGDALAAGNLKLACTGAGFNVPTGQLVTAWNDSSWDTEAQAAAAAALAAYDGPTNTEMVARTILAADYATTTALAAVKADTGPTLSGTNAIVAKLPSGATLLAPAGAVTVDLTQVVPAANNPNTLGDCFNTARAQAVGRWVLDPNSRLMRIYSSDGTTVVGTLLIGPNLTSPLSRTPQ